MSSRKNKPKIGYISLLRKNTDFRYLWLGQVVSLTGDWFNLVASAALISLLTGSGLAIGGLFVVRMLAPFLVSPIAGVLADKVNRKWLLIATDISRAFVVLGFFGVKSVEDVWILYVLTAFQMGISGFFMPTRSAILPELVSKEELGTANTMSSTTWSMMLAVGAALGGLVAGSLGIFEAFFMDALTFIVSGLLISRIRYRPTTRNSESVKTRLSFLKIYVEGIRYLKNEPEVLSISLLKPAFALSVVGAFQVVQVQIASSLFVIGRNGAISLGLIYAAIGLGTGIGPIVVRRYTGDDDLLLKRAIAVSFFVSTLGLLIVSELSNLWVVLLGTFIRGLGVGTNWVFSSQLLFHRIPNHIRGRIFSVEFAFLTLMNAAGAFWGGFLLDLSKIEVDDILRVMSALTVSLGLVWMISQVLTKHGRD